MAERRIRVLIIDDSPLFRTLLTGALNSDARLQVLPGANDETQARERILQYHPDVILLDLNLQSCDSLELLGALRDHYPVPLFVCSRGEKRDGPRAMRAIESGALDLLEKPRRGDREELENLGRALARKIRDAVDQARPVTAGDTGTYVPCTPFREVGVNPSRTLVVIGASTGGTEALNVLLSCAPADFPPTAIVQHMPANFTASFAARLNRGSRMSVSEAIDGQPMRVGHAVVARGDTHLTVRRATTGWCAHYTHQRLVNRHCPAVDELFESAVQAAGRNTIGILLTGMGSDGARGLLKLRRSGAFTMAQSKETCVVFGMPKVAIDLGAVSVIGAPEDMPELVLKELRSREAAPATR